MQTGASFVTGVRALLLLIVLGQTAHAETCRLALVLALDVSGSVDRKEYAQQINGVALALDHPDVRAQILNGGAAAVSLAVFEWSSRNHQFVIQPWVVLDSPVTLNAAIARIRAHRKQRAGLKTALGTALSFAGSLMREKDSCWYKTIDVSGDGRNNIGPTPRDAYHSPAFAAITVNALVVAPADSDPAEKSKEDLRAYYEAEVIRGAGAFAMIARGYDDYADAMRRKLLRELTLPLLGHSEF